MSFRRFGFGVLVFAVSWLPAAMGQAQVSAVLSIDYTGGLFGYYRIEPHADALLGGTEETLPPVAEFLKRRKEDDQLLVGMGNNFGPEFGAALQLEGRDECLLRVPVIKEEPYERRLPPVVLYKDDTRFAKMAHCDNVAAFLMYAGYRAVVPGREDFLYSAKWLRTIAVELTDSGEKKWIKNREKKLTMLAGNLRLEGGDSCPLLFANPAKKSVAGETQCVASAIGESVPTAQDWVERLDLTLDARSGVANQIKTRAKGNVTIRRQLLINQMSMTLNALSGCVKGGTLTDVQELTTEKGYGIRGSDVEVKENIADAVEAMGTQVRACPAHGSPEANDRQAVMVELARVLKLVEQPESGAKQMAEQDVFFSDAARAALRRLFLRVIAREQEDIGYTFADVTQGSTVLARKLLIGVVSREMKDAVSPGNLDIVEEKKTVAVLDPKRTVSLLIRAANLIATEIEKPHEVDSTLVMAQMPRTEAEELGAHLRDNLKKIAEPEKQPYRVDLILSEAQMEHASPKVELAYGRDDLTPVLTPHPAFDTDVKGLVQPISMAEVRELGVGRRLSNSRHYHTPWEGVTTTLFQLEKELGLRLIPVADEFTLLPGDETKTRAIELVLRELQVSSHADVVVLERRDLYLDDLPYGYTDYKVCDQPPTSIKTELQKVPDWDKRCRLHVALDRILWKGDYSERVMVPGKDLKTILKVAQDQVVAQESLAARDTLDQWLVTFGVTTSDKKNLTRLESNSNRFGIPWSEECHGDQSSKSPQYCVNGSTIADDAGYWLATSDHIANDSAIYTALRDEPSGYHQPKRVNVAEVTKNSTATKPNSEQVFLTDELTKTMGNTSQKRVEEDELTTIQNSGKGSPLLALQEDRSLVHLDFAKLVAGFNIRHPEGGNAAAAGFQGVTDTRPSQPNQQELDLEMMSRLSSDILTQSNPYSFSVGVQTDVEYDRSAQGNLTGKPVNASYALNNFSVGGFVQKRVPFWGDAKTTEGNWASRELPRTLVVLTPYQYQQQLTGNFLFLNFAAGNGELTVHSPTVTGHAYKVGIRHETTRGRRLSFDRGSYWEEGFEYVVQNNVGRSLTLTTPDAPPSQMPTKTCKSNGTSTLQQCFSTSSNPPFTVDGTTFVVKPYDLVTLPVSGLYWDIHLQRGLWKDAKSGEVKVNLTVDTKGDFYGERQSSLSTQTRYAFPITGAVSFPVLRNFSLGPTYSAFLYSNQVSQQSIVVHTFSISARWFYDRDSGVPFPRMAMFKGPASQDQTKTAKIK